MQDPETTITTFVADGDSRLASTPEYEAAVRSIELEVRSAYDARLNGASGLRRIILRFSRWREVRRRGAALTPPEALYTHPPR